MVTIEDYKAYRADLEQQRAERQQELSDAVKTYIDSKAEEDANRYTCEVETNLFTGTIEVLLTAHDSDSERNQSFRICVDSQKMFIVNDIERVISEDFTAFCHYVLTMIVYGYTFQRSLSEKFKAYYINDIQRRQRCQELYKESMLCADKCIVVA
jgi:hypothetical protein